MCIYTILHFIQSVQLISPLSSHLFSSHLFSSHLISNPNQSTQFPTIRWSPWAPAKTSLSTLFSPASLSTSTTKPLSSPSRDSVSTCCVSPYVVFVYSYFPYLYAPLPNTHLCASSPLFFFSTSPLLPSSLSSSSSLSFPPFSPSPRSRDTQCGQHFEESGHHRRIMHRLQVTHVTLRYVQRA